MTNTDKLYEAVKTFTDKRRENREAYLRKKKSIEGYRGSAGYSTDLEKAMKIRKDADAVAREECKKVVDEAIAEMYKKNRSRTFEAPTEEQIRLLTVAGMIRKPSRETLDTIANSLGGSPLALAALTSIAKEAWKGEKEENYVPNFEAQATDGYTAESTAAMIRALHDKCRHIMSGSGANMVREELAKVHQKHHGGEVDMDELPQEEPYESKSDFFRRELGTYFTPNGNATPINYALFSKAVD